MSWTKRDAAATFQRMVEDRHAEIGRTIAHLRMAKGWNQETLAHEAGVAVRTISRLENGGNEGRAGTMRKVAEALDSDLAGLLGGAQLLSSSITFEDGTIAEWSAKLDHIQAMLEVIVTRLDLSLSDDAREEAAGQALEEELAAGARSSQQSKNGTASNARSSPRKRKASLAPHQTHAADQSRPAYRNQSRHPHRSYGRSFATMYR